MKLSIIDEDSARKYLSVLQLDIGDWGGIVPRSQCSETHNEIKAVNLGNLFNFSKNLIDVLEIGAWNIFKFDNSSYFDRTESILLNQFATDNKTRNRWNLYDPVLIEGNYEDIFEVRSVIASLIFFTLFFEQHAHIVTSNYMRSCRLSIQDGFVYALFSNTDVQSNITSNIFEIENIPDRIPKWLNSDH